MSCVCLKKHARGRGRRRKRYPPSERIEINRIVEQSSVATRRTLEQIGAPRATLYRWYDQYQTGSPEALEDRPARPGREWNCIPNDVRAAINELAFEQSELSPRELAVWITNKRSYFVSQANVFRLLKSHDLITGPAFIVMKATSAFTDKTTAPNEMLQQRDRIKRQTIEHRRLQHRKLAA